MQPFRPTGLRRLRRTDPNRSRVWSNRLPIPSDSSEDDPFSLEEIIKFLDNPVLFPAGATAEPDPILWQHCLEAGPMSLWYTKYLLWIHDVSGQFPDTLIQAILDHPTIRIFDRKVLHYAVYAGSDCYILELASNRPLPPPRLRPDHSFPFKYTVYDNESLAEEPELSVVSSTDYTSSANSVLAANQPTRPMPI